MGSGQLSWGANCCQRRGDDEGFGGEEGEDEGGVRGRRRGGLRGRCASLGGQLLHPRTDTSPPAHAPCGLSPSSAPARPPSHLITCRGPLSTAFQDLLRNECAPEDRHPVTRACPMWPDPYDPSQHSGGAAGAGGQRRRAGEGKGEGEEEELTENFALAPPWLVASFSARGVRGHWGQHPGVPVQQVREKAQTLAGGRDVEGARGVRGHWGLHPGVPVQQVSVCGVG